MLWPFEPTTGVRFPAGIPQHAGDRPGGRDGVTYRLRWVRSPAPVPRRYAIVPRMGHRGANPAGEGSNPSDGTNVPGPRHRGFDGLRALRRAKVEAPRRRAAACNSRRGNEEIRDGSAASIVQNLCGEVLGLAWVLCWIPNPARQGSIPCEPALCWLWCNSSTGVRETPGSGASPESQPSSPS